MIFWHLEKYPSWPKGLPWKGSRSLTAAHGFKSHLLRLVCKYQVPWQINSNATLKILLRKFQRWNDRIVQRTKPLKRKNANRRFVHENLVISSKSEEMQRISQFNWCKNQTTLTWEFDPGSGWTLAACLTHASRTDFIWSLAIIKLVADGWVTRE